MQSSHRYIIHILIALLFIIGLVLFFWRDEFFESLSENSGIYNNDFIINQSSLSAQDVLDSSILDNAKFIVLRNNVNQFDFNTVCRDVSSQRLVGVNSTLNSAQFNASILCAIGNSSPFVVPAPVSSPLKN
jgi:hypothetical protein